MCRVLGFGGWVQRGVDPLGAREPLRLSSLGVWGWGFGFRREKLRGEGVRSRLRGFEFRVSGFEDGDFAISDLGVQEAASVALGENACVLDV